MGTEDFGRQFSRHIEQRWGQHRSGWAGDWSGGEGPRGRRGRQGPPPWVAELFGLAQTQPQRGPKVRRGDVRAAILDMLKDEPMNGYQLISQIAERSGGAWKPSPGSVYPTIQQLEDEGLVEADDERGRRTLRLTDEGRRYVEEHAVEMAETWAPFGEQRQAQRRRVRRPQARDRPGDGRGVADRHHRHRPAAPRRHQHPDRDPPQALRPAGRRRRRPAGRPTPMVAGEEDEYDGADADGSER